MNKLKETAVNPVAVIVGVVVLVLIVGYFGWLRPKMQEDKILAEWTSPENVKARSPEGRVTNPAHEAFVEQLRAKERGGAAGGQSPRSR